MWRALVLCTIFKELVSIHYQKTADSSRWRQRFAGLHANVLTPTLTHLEGTASAHQLTVQMHFCRDGSTENEMQHLQFRPVRLILQSILRFFFFFSFSESESAERCVVHFLLNEKKQQGRGSFAASGRARHRGGGWDVQKEVYLAVHVCCETWHEESALSGYDAQTGGSFSVRPVVSAKRGRRSEGSFRPQCCQMTGPASAARVQGSNPPPPPWTLSSVCSEATLTPLITHNSRFLFR